MSSIKSTHLRAGSHYDRCHSVELDLNQMHLESGQKRKGAKMFGSLERGLDKMITMLTPSKRKGSAKEGPRKLKVCLSIRLIQVQWIAGIKGNN